MNSSRNTSPRLRSTSPLDAELERALTERLRRHAQGNFERFVQAVSPGFIVNWHHRVLCNTLDAWVRGDIPRLMVFMPPRHGKSYLVSEHLPAYMLALNPDERVMLTAYAAQLVRRFMRKLQNLLRGEKFLRLFPSTRIATAGDGSGYIASQDELEVIQRQGGIKVSGVGGGITGRGFNGGIIDDPIADREAADSPVQRQNAIDWYWGTFWTRQENDRARILLTQTRWHPYDPAGQLLDAAKQGGEHWHVLWLPARKEEDIPEYLALNPNVTLIGQEADQREPGQGLWIGKYGQDWYDRLPEVQTERDYLSQYQNRPASEEGSIFKRYMLNTCERTRTDEGASWKLPSGHVVPVRDCLRFQTVDLATSTKTAADYTVVGSFYFHPGTRALLLVDLFRERIEGGIHEGVIESQRMSNGCNYSAIEKQFAGLSIIQNMRRRGCPIRELDADRDKFSRAYSALHYFEGGTFCLAADLPHRADAIAELLSFQPGCAHDDIADVVVYAALHISGMLLNAAEMTPSTRGDNLPDRRTQTVRTVRPPRPRRRGR